MDQSDKGGFLDKAKEAIGNIFGGKDRSDDAAPAASAPTTAGDSGEYKTATDQDSATGDYPTATGAGTGVLGGEGAAWDESSTSQAAPEYKSGTDQDSPTGDYPGAMDANDSTREVATGAYAMDDSAQAVETSSYTPGAGTGSADMDATEWTSGSTGASTWDATTDTSVVTPSGGLDSDLQPRLDATPETYGTRTSEGGYDAGAGAGSSLSGSDTRFASSDDADTSREQPERMAGEESLDQP